MIPLSFPKIGKNEMKYVQDCLETGWISSAGTYVTQFGDMVAGYAGSKYGLACMNGTAGLHISLVITGIGIESHIIVPNITFVASLNAISYTGAEPILIDADEHTWQMDLDLLENFLNEETYEAEYDNGSEKLSLFYYKKTRKPIKGIMPVHVLGNMVNMERLMQLADKYKLIVIEDSTESLGSFYNGKHSGTFGTFGVFSFNGNKIISTGGGGVVVTDDHLLAQRVKHLTTQAKSSNMEYIHDEIGYNYRLVNILAAVGVGQMESFPEFLLDKKETDAYYREELNGLGDIVFQEVTPGVDPNCWLFTFKTARMRGLLEYLNNNGVISRPFWKPMNQLTMYQHLNFIQNDNVSDILYRSCISIPCSVGITSDQKSTVVNLIRKYFTNN